MPTEQLEASYDVHCTEGSPNTNFGEQRINRLRQDTGLINRSFVSWAGIPEPGTGVLVSNAYIRVFLRGANWSGGPHDITARRITEKWKESTLTFNNQPDVDGSVSAVANVTNGVDGQAVDIDVTSIMAGVMTGNAWYGFRFTTASGTVLRDLYDSEAADPDLRPQLFITWSSLPEAPIDMSPSGGKRVSLQKPTFSHNFIDPDGDDQTAFQLLIDDASTVDGDGKLVSPEHDTGTIPSLLEEFDSSLSGTGGSLPTFVNAGTAANGTGDITPGLPASWAKNDIFLLFVENDSADPGPATPDGWSHVTASPVSTTGTRLSVFWRRATLAETDPTVGDTGDHQLARIIAVRGCPVDGFPWELTTASTESTSDTSGSATGHTTTQANTFIVIAASSNFDAGADDTAGYSAFTNAALGSLTERIDNRAAAGNGGTLGVATGTKATAGALGSTTYTLANAGSKAHLVISLAPATSYGPTWAGITDGNTRYWQVRGRDESGNWSPWSEVQAFTRTSKGTLAISSPATGTSVEETTPPIITTLTGRAQQSISYKLERQDSTTSLWSTVWEQDRRSAPANSGSAYNFGVPEGKITDLSTNYRLTVRSWDTFDDRDATPGDPTYVQAQSTFTFARSATPSPVTVLTAAAEASNGPGVLLTFNRAAGQASPDYFCLVVDGKRVMDRIEPADIIDGGDPIVFSFVYYRAEPYESHTFEVEAVTYASGVLKHSQSNDTDSYTPKPKGKWLMDDDKKTYKAANPPRRVKIRGTDTDSLGIAQSAATYRVVNRRDPVTIYDSIGGYEGTISGQIHAADPDCAGGLATFNWMKHPANAGRRLRYIATGMAIPVELQEVGTFTPRGDWGEKKVYDVSFTIAQIDEFSDVE